MSIGNRWFSQLRIDSSQRVNLFRSLPARISIFVFATSLVTSLFVTAISAHAIDSFLRGKLELKFPEIAAQVGQRLDAWYTERILNLGELAASDVLRNNVGQLRPSGRSDAESRAFQDVAAYLDNVRDRFAHFDSLLILRPDGETLISVGSVGHFSRDTTDQLLAAQDTPRPTLTSVGEHFVQIIPTRIQDGRGKRVGVLAAVMCSSASGGECELSAEFPTQIVPIDVDSGTVSATGGGTDPVVVFSHNLNFVGAPWTRVYFSDVLLSGSSSTNDASFLRVSAAADGAVQVLNRAALVKWINSTCYFNGDSVLLELLA